MNEAEALKERNAAVARMNTAVKAIADGGSIEDAEAAINESCEAGYQWACAKARREADEMKAQMCGMLRQKIGEVKTAIAGLTHAANMTRRGDARRN